MEEYYEFVDKFVWEWWMEVYDIKPLENKIMQTLNQFEEGFVDLDAGAIRRHTLNIVTVELFPLGLLSPFGCHTC